MKTRARSNGDGGFALAMVVLLLFAIGVAGAAGFQVVNNEFTLTTQNRDGQEALVIARAGLQRFLGTTVGQVGDSVSYAIDNGIATVTTRKVVSRDSLTHLYYIRSEGSVADARTPLLPAKRVVGTYAWHRQSPIPLNAAVLLSGGNSGVYSAMVSGADQAGAAPCYGDGTGVSGFGIAGTAEIYAPGTASSITADKGHDVKYEKYSGFNEVYDTVGIRWDILSDPSFPVDFTSMPNFDSISVDSYPIVRINGSYGDTVHGRGVLIVQGTLDLPGNFHWQGIILAGRLGSSNGAVDSQPSVSGVLIGGLNGSNPSSALNYGRFNYNSCHFSKANKSLSFLQVVPNTLFEING